MRKKRFFRRVVYEYPDRIFVMERDPNSFRGWLNRMRKESSLGVELGMGDGDFLVQQAHLHPEQFFLGVEIKPDRIYRAYLKAEERKLKNIAFLQTPVERIPEYHFPAIDQLFVLFPDPWPKKRHARRRMTSPNFLQLYQQLLSSSGSIVFKTDNAELFQYSVECFQHKAWNIVSIDQDYRTESTLKTVYERKFLAEQKPIHFLEASIPFSTNSFRKFLTGLLHFFPRS